MGYGIICRGREEKKGGINKSKRGEMEKGESERRKRKKIK
jgi:hypothetical protein